MAPGYWLPYLASARAIILAMLLICPAEAASAGPPDKVVFMTSWYAQAEHGGFYQAKATGLYDKAGFDVCCWPASPTSITASISRCLARSKTGCRSRP